MSPVPPPPANVAVAPVTSPVRATETVCGHSAKESAHERPARFPPPPPPPAAPAALTAPSLRTTDTFVSAPS
eukprot:5048494-Amphidinium_carterae.1